MDSYAGRIRKDKELPLIGVIGSSAPVDVYRRDMGVSVGYELREYVDQKGTIFTGGVSGVGVDVYTGVIELCKARSQEGVMPDDRFFIMVPEFVDVDLGEYFDLHSLDGVKKRIRYDPPTAYNRLASSTPRGHIDVVKAGNDMEERRKYMSEIADVLVVVNGGIGTLDEAFNMLKASKGIVALDYTGGAARILRKIRENDVQPLLVSKLEKNGFQLGGINTDLIYVADDIEGMMRHLYRIL